MRLRGVMAAGEHAQLWSCQIDLDEEIMTAVDR